MAIVPYSYSVYGARSYGLGRPHHFRQSLNVAVPNYGYGWGYGGYGYPYAGWGGYPYW